MLFKKLLKITGWILLGLTVIVTLYILTATLLSIIPVNKHPVIGNDVPIYITTNGDHTDILLPVKNQIKNWGAEVKYADTKENDTIARYLAFGWGNKDFYLNTPTWAQFKLSLGIKAALGIGASAMHTEFCPKVKESAYCKKIMLSKSQYIKLVTYIDNYFKRGADGHIMNIPNVHYDNYDAFYDATGTYDLFYTCNTWANDALKACGQKACLWTPFDKGIFYQYSSP